MNPRALAAGCLVAAALSGMAGCSVGGSDEPTTSAAGKTLAGWMDKLPDKLVYGVTPLIAWHVSDEAGSDRSSGCGDGKARRTYAATIDLPANDADPGTRAGLIAGEVAFQGWRTSYPSKTTTDGGTVTATRKAEDATGSRLVLRFTEVDGGWHYDVAARTACLSTSG